MCIFHKFADDVNNHFGRDLRNHNHARMRDKRPSMLRVSLKVLREPHGVTEEKRMHVAVCETNLDALEPAFFVCFPFSALIVSVGE
jgi:hypothetical protein